MSNGTELRSVLPSVQATARRQVTAIGGIIILMVLCASYTLGYQGSIGHSQDLSGLPPVGFLALQLFLASTGFRLTEELHGAGGYAFLRGRVMRFGPLVIPSVLVAFMLIRYAGVPVLAAEPGSLAANLVMAADLFGVPRIDDSHWRLKIEMMVSVELGLIWFGLGKKYLRPVLILGLLASACLLAGEPVRQDRLTLAGLLTLDGYLPHVVFGVALLHVQRSRADWQWLVVGAAAAALGFFSNTPVHGMVLLAGFGLLMLAAAGRLPALGRMGWLVRLGELAFPIYVIHRVAGFVIIYHLEQRGVDPAAAMVVAGALAVGAGWLMHHCLERPAAVLMVKAEQLVRARWLWARPVPALDRPDVGGVNTRFV